MFNNSVFKSSVNTKKWFINSGIRAIKTFSQTAIALIPIGITVNEVDWKMILGTALLSSIVSLLTSMSGIPEVESEEREDNDAIT